jgi:starch synthase
VAVAGEGEPSLRAALERAAAEWPAEVRIVGPLGAATLHRMVAATDVMVLPHRFQPGGSWQLVAQRYGALPVAHASAGHRDTIVDCDAQAGTGTGILFDEPTVAALLGGVERAIALMRSPRWPALRRRLMRLDLSWERAARRFARLYQGAETI